MTITIRDVNLRFWREVKAIAAQEGITLGEAVNLALERWIREKKQMKTKKTKSFWDLKPFSMPGCEQDSLRVDEILYRGKI